LEPSDDKIMDSIFSVIDFVAHRSSDALICKYNIDFGWVPWDIGMLILVCYNFYDLNVDIVM
jgi:hypothetical protein